jgi:UDP-N-acetylglucosamine 1-carboxyvinyltransferase
VALADTLTKMGADIQGAGTSVITITGVPALKPVDVKIIPDRIEAGTFLIAAVLTRGSITVLNSEPDHLGALIDKLRLVGADIQVDGKTVRVKNNADIQSVDLKTQPYPGFPTDMQAQFMVLMGIASGTSMITETIFENRFIHVSELKRMGADIQVSGNSAIVKGVPNLSAAQVMATDLRASASLILAGLVAEGTTEVNRVYHLDRGYQSLEKKFAALGAAILRLK